MQRFWGVLRQKEKIIADTILETDATDMLELEDIVDGLCRKLDIPRPVILGKHVREYGQFFRTRFYVDDFIESINFRTFEVEYLKDKEKKGGKKS